LALSENIKTIIKKSEFWLPVGILDAGAGILLVFDPFTTAREWELHSFTGNDIVVCVVLIAEF
jgi:hypothetical protein